MNDGTMQVDWSAALVRDVLTAWRALDNAQMTARFAEAGAEVHAEVRKALGAVEELLVKVAR